MKLRLRQEEIPPHLQRFFRPTAGLGAKNLMLVPQRFAIAMQERGWVVRSEIVWAKTSAMPESVRDRPTSAWEPIWMFAKSQRYFYDGDAVRQPASETSGWARQRATGFDTWKYNDTPERIAATGQRVESSTFGSGGANLRNVWTLGPSSFAGEHFATFPPEIPRRCILAGTSERGACPACGAPWVRVVEREANRPGVTGGVVWSGSSSDSTDVAGARQRLKMRGGGFGGGSSDTLGWAPSCSCPPADPVPCVVLDPFLGSGTTAMVADRLGRDAIGIELSESYAEGARRRIEQDAGTLFGDPVTVEAPAQLDLFGAVAG